MILSIVSLVLLVFGFLRFVAPLHAPGRVKLVLAAFIAVSGCKFLVYQYLGGRFYAPDLPLPVLYALEFGYNALVFLVLLLFVRDMALLVSLLLRKCGLRAGLPLTADAQRWGLLVLALLLGGTGLWQAVRVPPVVTHELRIPNLPRALDGLVIVQLTDIHVGPFQKHGWLAEVVARANAARPDLTVLTGDYADGMAEELAREMRPLKELKASLGVLAVPGNHEYYYDYRSWMRVYRELDVDMLANAHRVLAKDGASFVVAGVTDSVAARFGEELPNLAKALHGAPEGLRILLCHRPGPFPENAGISLQLSGHTHGGVLFFLQKVVAAFNGGYVDGVSTLPGNDAHAARTLFVHPGSGIWNGFSCRLGVPSEIARIVLRAG